MPLETGTYISDLVATNPAAGDQVNQGDDHLRLVKSTVKTTFPSITGAVSGTHTRLNAVTGQFTDGGLFQAPAGAVGGPAVSWAADTASGLYRIAANDYGYSINGTKLIEFSAAAVAVTGTVAVSSTATLSGNATVGGTLGVTGVATFTAVPVFSAGIDSSTATTQSAGDNSTKVATTAYADTGLALKAPLASPALTGTPAAPTAAVGTNTTQLATTAFVAASTFAGAFGNQLLHVRDEKAANTAGGGFTSGAFQVRTLNTSVTNQISGASLASNQITLPAGTYHIEASAPAYKTNAHKARLWNATDSAILIEGPNEYAISFTDGFSNPQGVQTRALVNGVFTLAGTKALELRHQAQTTSNSNGFGQVTNMAVNEVYAEVRIWKIG